jgi:hypothetical protein
MSEGTETSGTPRQTVLDPGPDGFAVPGITEIIPLMPEGTCLASSRLLTSRYPALRYQDGILVMRVGGELRASVRHAWNVGPSGEIIDTTNRPMTFGPGKEVTYSYIPDGPDHDTDRRALAAKIGEPAPDDDDPDAQDEGDQLALAWLEQTTARNVDTDPPEINNALPPFSSDRADGTSPTGLRREPRA